MAEPSVIVLDCETTGTDRTRDQVIEVCIQRGLRGSVSAFTWRIKPSVPIHPDAQAAHGITLEQLAACPPFAAVSLAIATALTEADVIVGYNVAFDLEMLHGEFSRIGKTVDTSRKIVVDAYRLWQQCEPRKLGDAHRRFVGETFEGAHSAAADVAATGRVLEAMLGAFELDAGDWAAIAHRADPEHGAWIGPSRHLRWEHGVVVVAFGKHRGVALHDLVAGADRGFVQWVMTKDFPLHVKEVCRAALVRPRDEFLAWITERFPPPQEAA